MKPTGLRDEAVYDKAERDEILKKMRAVSAQFYSGAVQARCHPFIEFCGVMNEYLTICEAASKKGIDFTQANRHSGSALPIQTHNAHYLGEKIGCIYGPSLQDPKNFRAFIAAMDLPFGIQIVPKPTMNTWIDPETGEQRYEPLEE